MPRWNGTPKAVQAAEMYEAGMSRCDIAKYFKWTVKTASVNIARGKKWNTFLQVNGAGNRHRKAEERRRQRPRVITRQLRKLLREAKALGLNPMKMAS